MQFITVLYNYHPQQYRIEQLPTLNDRERWKVSGKNGFLILSNNRPVLIRKNLKHWKPDWQTDGKGLESKVFTKALYEAIEEAVNANRN